jgi:hypothetical protein
MRIGREHDRNRERNPEPKLDPPTAWRLVG